MSSDDDIGEVTAGAGRLLFAQSCTFMLSSPAPNALPAPGLPEVAFAGRSNAGKSSLINALTGRRDLARTSKTPGRTRSINMFDLGGRLHLVDLPGYGYARAARTEMAHWARMVDGYLSGRASLRRVCMLLDARRGPTDRDLEALDRLDIAGMTYQFVLTKADKAGRAELADMTGRTRELLHRPAAFPRIVTTSARTGAGIAGLRDELAALAAPATVR